MLNELSMYYHSGTKEELEIKLNEAFVTFVIDNKQTLICKDDFLDLMKIAELYFKRR